MARIDLSSARRSLTVWVASARRASGLSSPERRYCSIFWRAPSIVYFSVYSRCFTSMISSISRRWYTRLPDRFLAGFRKRNWLSQYRRASGVHALDHRGAPRQRLLEPLPFPELHPKLMIAGERTGGREDEIAHPREPGERGRLGA